MAVGSKNIKRPSRQSSYPKGIQRASRTAADCAIVLTDFEDRILDWTAAAVRMFGYDGPEIVGRPASSLLAKAHTANSQRRGAIHRGADETEEWVLPKSGEKFRAAIVTTPRWDDAHRIAGFARVIRRRSFQSRDMAPVIELLPDPVFVFDPDQRCSYVNRAAERLLRTPSDAIQGKHPEELLADQAGALRPAIEQAMTGRVSTSAELQNWGAGARCFEARIYPMPDGGVAAVLWDVTAHRLTRQALDEKTDQLAQFNSELRELAYVASHDLQEPLRTITSFLQLMLKRRKAGRTDVDECVPYIVGSVQKLSNLIRDLSAFSTLISTPPGPKRAVDMNRVLDSVRQDLDRAIEESRAVLAVQRLPIVRGKSGQLELLFRNLLSNAMKFQPPGRQPRIEVSAEPAGDGWLLRVQDNGIGIAPRVSRPHLQYVQTAGRREIPRDRHGIGDVQAHR
ncbi:MAG: sensor histidine kinase [Bryobacteraceae bacterium]